jgi:hypothetical protein
VRFFGRRVNAAVMDVYQYSPEPFYDTLFSWAYKWSFGVEFFIFEEGIPRPLPRFVISPVSNFPYDARKAAALTILASKTPNPQILLRHPTNGNL